MINLESQNQDFPLNFERVIFDYWTETEIIPFQYSTFINEDSKQRTT